MRQARLYGAVALAAIVLAVIGATHGAAAPAKPIKGIDVSRFQGKIAWKAVGKTDLRFAYVQASRGTGKDCTVAPDTCGGDPYWDRNYSKAKNEAGLRVGAYHRAFAQGGTRSNAREDARAEANRFIGVVGKVRRHDLRPALDLEYPFKHLDPNRLRLWIWTWMNRVEKKLRVKPIIYTNQSSWAAAGDTTSFATSGYPLWVADFDADRPAMPASNWAGKGWTIWQYTSTGRVRGITGNVDRNRLKKGFAKLEPR